MHTYRSCRGGSFCPRRLTELLLRCELQGRGRHKKKTVDKSTFKSCGTMGLFCESDIKQQEDVYHLFVLVSIIITICCVFVQIKSNYAFHQQPRIGFAVMFAFAILKFSVGVLLIVVQPSSFNCPRECDYSQCEQIHPNYVYPAIVFLIALYWTYLSARFYKMYAGPAVVAVQLVEVLPCEDAEEDDEESGKK